MRTGYTRFRTVFSTRLLAVTGLMTGLILSACGPIDSAGVNPMEGGQEVLGTAQQGSQVNTTIGGYPVEMTFTQSHLYARDAAIHNHLVRLINNTPAGSTIRAVIHNIAFNNVYDALVNAKNRGVNVYAVLPADKVTAGSAEEALFQALNSGTPGRMKACSKNGNSACMSDEAGAYVHTKLMLFSNTKDSAGIARSDVVWFGSANLNSYSGTDNFNNAVTVFGDRDFYLNFRDNIFEKYYQQVSLVNNDFYNPGTSGYFISTLTNMAVYASPEKDSDMYLNRLNDVIPDTSCRIRVGHASFRDARKAVATRLAELKQAGCAIWVSVNEIQPESLAILKGAGIPVRQNNVHDKMMLLYSRYNGSTTPRLNVITGSHNLIYTSNYSAEEIMVRIYDKQEVYDAYYTHFNNAYNNGTPL